MIELAIGIFALAAAILLPGGGAAERASRLRRVPAASAAFLVPQITSTLIWRARGIGAAAEAPLWVSGIGWGAMFVGGLIFFGAGDRIARALGAVRSPAWAFAGLAGGIAWSYLLNFLLFGVHAWEVGLQKLLLDFAAAALAAALAWYVLLPAPETHVTDVFD